MLKVKKALEDFLCTVRDVKALAVLAFLTSLSVVLGFYSLQLTENLRISFTFLAEELAGMVFGPLVGGVMGGVADWIKYLVHPTGPFTPGFTISAVVCGVIYGGTLYKKPLSIGRVALANGLVTVIVHLFLNTYWLTLLYGSPFFALLPARIAKEAVMLPLSVVLFYAFARALKRAGALTAEGGIFFRR